MTTPKPAWREPEIDPLQEQRDKWKADKDPSIRTLGYISDAHSDEEAYLLAGASPEDWAQWNNDPDFVKMMHHANTYRIARLGREQRNLALGIGTRRGQGYALRALDEGYRRKPPKQKRGAKRGHGGPSGDESETGSSVDNMSDDQVRRELDSMGEEDDSG